MQAEDQHRAGGDQGDNAALYVAEGFCQVYEGVYGYEVDYIVQRNMQDEIAFVYVPVKQNEAGEQGGCADKQVFSESLLFQFTPLLVEIAQEEETQAADESVVGDVWGIVVVFVGAVQDHGCDGEYKHYGFAMLVLVEHVCYDMHYEQGD